MKMLPIKFQDQEYDNLKRAAGIKGLPMARFIKQYINPVISTTLIVNAKKRKAKVSMVEYAEDEAVETKGMMVKDAPKNELLYGEKRNVWKQLLKLS